MLKVHDKNRVKIAFIFDSGSNIAWQGTANTITFVNCSKWKHHQMFKSRVKDSEAWEMEPNEEF